MKNLITILTITLLSSCSNNIGSTEVKEAENNSFKNETDRNAWNYEKVSHDNLASFLNNICSNKDSEFIDLYPTIDSISSDEYENIILVDSLKTKGFNVTNRGRGNWTEGPRIVSFTMSNGQRECQVDKLYYSTEHENKYKVTERIKCVKASR